MEKKFHIATCLRQHMNLKPDSVSRFGIRLRLYSIIVQNAIFKNAYTTGIFNRHICMYQICRC